MNPDFLRDLWLSFQREHRCSIDQMLCDRALREEFVAIAHEVIGCDDERQLLWALVSLRKRKRLPAVQAKVKKSSLSFPGVTKGVTGGGKLPHGVDF